MFSILERSQQLPDLGKVISGSSRGMLPPRDNLPRELVNSGNPSYPVNSDHPNDPVNSDHPSNTVNSDLPRDPANNDLPS